MPRSSIELYQPSIMSSQSGMDLPEQNPGTIRFPSSQSVMTYILASPAAQTGEVSAARASARSRRSVDLFMIESSLSWLSCESLEGQERCQGRTALGRSPQTFEKTGIQGPARRPGPLSDRIGPIGSA